jgi:hypothetical protein
MGKQRCTIAQAAAKRFPRADTAAGSGRREASTFASTGTSTLRRISAPLDIRRSSLTGEGQRGAMGWAMTVRLGAMQQQF